MSCVKVKKMQVIPGREVVLRLGMTPAESKTSSVAVLIPLSI